MGCVPEIPVRPAGVFDCRTDAPAHPVTDDSDDQLRLMQMGLTQQLQRAMQKIITEGSGGCLSARVGAAGIWHRV